MIGQSIGRYRIEQKLGEGGMSIVYKAYDANLDTFVAIKVIRQSATLNEDHRNLLERFETEARRVARLSHPNIIPILDYGKNENGPYLVMKYITGGDLKTRLGQPIPLQEILRLVIPIARALSYAHQQGIIHRDVKPANILLTETNEPMLTDFGLAKVQVSDASKSGPGTGTKNGPAPARAWSTSRVVGTLEYMAPEQAMGNAVDHRADIYSLGLIFYEMMTGRRPFIGDEKRGVLTKKLEDPVPSPRQYVPELPEAAEQIVVKALASNPNERYQTMSAFADALERLIFLHHPVKQVQPAPTFQPDPALFEMKGSTAWPAVNSPLKPPAQPTASTTAPTRPGHDLAAINNRQPPKKAEITLRILAGLILLICVSTIVVIAILNNRAGAAAPTPAVEAASILIQATPSETAAPASPPTSVPTADMTLAAATERAANRMARTTTAQTQLTGTAQGMESAVQQLVSQDLLKDASGAYQPVPDFDQTWAQIDWYQWWNTGYTPTSFVLRTHTAWESANRSSNWNNAGCGFVFRARDEQNHYIIYLGLDDYVYLKAYVKGNLRELGKAYAGNIDHMSGEADILLLVDGTRVAYFIDQQKILDLQVLDPQEGSLAYTLVSGTNQGFGTHCSMTGTELWILNTP